MTYSHTISEEVTTISKTKRKIKQMANLTNAAKILFALACIIMGIDKFAEFLPHCTLLSFIPKEMMWGTGVLEIILGVMIFLNKNVSLAIKLGTAIMAGGVALHLFTGTYDMSGALISTILGAIYLFGSRN